MASLRDALHANVWEETAVAAPAVPAVSKRDGHSSISIHSDDDGANSSMTVSFSDDALKFRASVEGKVEFNDEENDIVSLGAGGTARLQETRGGVTQRIELSSRGDKIERRYFVNDAEHPYDDRARALMQQSVKELVRTGMDAEARVKRFYARGGAGAVLQEIEEIQSDYVRGLYLGVLSGIAKLSPAELDRAVALAGATLGADAPLRADREHGLRPVSHQRTRTRGRPQRAERRLGASVDHARRRVGYSPSN